MSWYSNTLFPIVEYVFNKEEDLPTDPKIAAQKLHAYGFTRVGNYIADVSSADLQNIYHYCGLVREELIGESEW